MNNARSFETKSGSDLAKLMGTSNLNHSRRNNGSIGNVFLVTEKDILESAIV